MIRSPLTATSAEQRSGRSAATMAAARDPESNPATVARGICRGVHRCDGVDSSRDLLPVAGGLIGAEARRAVAPQVWDDHVIPLVDQ